MKYRLHHRCSSRLSRQIQQIFKPICIVQYGFVTRVIFGQKMTATDIQITILPRYFSPHIMYGN
jgi:hypothetical protein